MVLKISNKIWIVLIVILILAIFYTGLRINNFSNDANTTGKVKGIISEIPQMLNSDIKTIPQKNNSLKVNILAKNYVLIDTDSFYPLLEKDSHSQVAIASTTKIMTAIIALENFDLKDVVSISKEAASQIGSDIELRIGEKLTIESLLYALLVKSGNDAAMALAEHLPGGFPAFVEKMNKKANYLGLKNTNYKDPAGLDDSGYSSAYDLAIVTAYAMRNPIFNKIIRTQEFTITSLDGKISHRLESSNRLIKSDEPLYYPLAIGVKTGFTPMAGHSLVSAGESNGKKLISVILNTYENTVDASAKESRKLLKYGFEDYQLSP